MKAPPPKPADRRPVPAVPRVTRVQAIEPTPAPKLGLRDSFRRLFGRGTSPSGDLGASWLESEDPVEAKADGFESRLGLDSLEPLPAPEAGTTAADGIAMSLRNHKAARMPGEAFLGPQVHDASVQEIAANLMALLQHLAQFCMASQVTERGRWSVLLRVPFAGLEQTRVRLEISPTEIELRFETEHPPSRQLLGNCASLVADALRELVPDGRQIEVRLW